MGRSDGADHLSIYPTQKSKGEQHQIFEEIYDVFKQTNMTEKLLKITNYDEFLEVWSSK